MLAICYLAFRVVTVNKKKMKNEFDVRNRVNFLLSVIELLAKYDGFHIVVF